MSHLLPVSLYQEIIYAYLLSTINKLNFQKNAQTVKFTTHIGMVNKVILKCNKQIKYFMT